MVFAFANTSKEKAETLEFANLVDKEYGLDLVWLEPVFSYTPREGTTFKVVNYDTAKRNGEVFEEMILHYGIPNQAYPHCTREMKTQPLQKYAKHIFGGGHYTAIGIRADEIDRVNDNYKELKYYYPLVMGVGTTKPEVNKFWRDQPFRLQLKGYEGNCNKCWKKSIRKLKTIEVEEANRDTWWSDMEEKYGGYVPTHRKRKPLDKNLTFYRNNNSSLDLLEMSKTPFNKSLDDSVNYDYQMTLIEYDYEDDLEDDCGQSCEPFK